MTYKIGELKSRVDKILAQNDPYPAPVITGVPFSSKLNLFHADSEVRTAKTQLIIKKIFKKSKSLGTERDWAELQNKRNKLRDLFVTSNSAINENKASLFRFQERIREKEVQKFLLHRQIKGLKFDIEWYNSVAAKMEKYVKEYSKFEKFLESVAEVATGFLSVQDILNRYETLEHTREESTKILERELEEAAEMRRQMTSLVEERSAQLKSLSNKLIFMQGYNDSIELQAGCWDLAVKMARRRGQTLASLPGNTEHQLEYIQNTIQFYKEVAILATAIRNHQLNIDRN